MQEISDRIGENQFGKCNVKCMDCHEDFAMHFERTGPDQIKVKAGAIGKRNGEYFFKCPDCYKKDQSFGQECETYSRVVGYLRPISNWNNAKQEEYKCRKPFKVEIE